METQGAANIQIFQNSNITAFQLKTKLVINIHVNIVYNQFKVCEFGRSHTCIVLVS